MSQRILLKTTIPATEDDWHIGRFSLLAAHLAGLEHEGAKRYEVVSRDRRVDGQGNDIDLASAANGGFDQVWLFAVDVVEALTEVDAENLRRFREAGGGLLLTRDHQDLGAGLTRLGPLGRTQHFQTVNPEADIARRCCDDTQTPTITWPNYHSSANGDLQPVEVPHPIHPVMLRADGSAIERLPGHPHEGAVGIPPELLDHARIIAIGRSRLSGSRFNLAVAIEEPGKGRAVADSSFHHFADYNWNPQMGCPSFVDEPAGNQVIRECAALNDVHAYVANAAAWLS